MSAAVQLSRRLPATFDALTSGRLDWPKVQAITETTLSLPEPVAILVERAVLPGAAGQNVPALRRALARAVIDADPAAAGECADHANSERRVVFTPAPDGMSELWALLPAEGAIRAKAGLDALATAARSPGDDRSADQRRADALIDLLSAGVSEPVGAVGPAAPPGARAGRAPEVVVTVSLETLLGLADDPAHLAGYGPVLADIARDVAARGTWRCAVVDGTHGTLLGLGRATFTPEYRPGSPLADHITVRDRTCTFPGCHQPARRCDNDHRTPHPKGPTCECNVAALCRHHHRLKHRAGFGAGLSDDPSHPPGSVIWTTPTGRTYDRPATRIATAPREHAPPSDA